MEVKMEKENNPVKARLKLFIASQGLSEREFCRKIGVSSAYVESIKRSVSSKVMQTIGIHFPTLNPLWLLMGRGEMENLPTEGKKEGEPSGGVLPSEMLAELLVEARNEKAWLRAENERLASIVESQQRTIETLAYQPKKASAHPGEDAGCAVVG